MDECISPARLRVEQYGQGHLCHQDRMPSDRRQAGSTLPHEACRRQQAVLQVAVRHRQTGSARVGGEQAPADGPQGSRLQSEIDE